MRGVLLKKGAPKSELVLYMVPARHAPSPFLRERVYSFFLPVCAHV